MTSKVQIIKESTLNPFLKSAEDALVVLCCSVKWCPTNKTITPQFEKLSSFYPNAVFGRFEAETCPTLNKKVQISSVPTFLFYRFGALIEIVEGANIGEVHCKIASLIAERSDLLRNGTSITLQGLKTSKYNGSPANIVGYDASKDRYFVVLGYSSEHKLIPSARQQNGDTQRKKSVTNDQKKILSVGTKNLIQLGKIAIKRNSEYEVCELAGIKQDKFVVKTKTGKQELHPFKECLMSKDHVVRVTGLSQATEYNGFLGTIRSHTGSGLDRRYLVELNDGRLIKLRPSHVLPLGSS